MTYNAKLARRSSFTFNLTERSGIKFIVIVDNNVGVSVTNNIENIIQYISEEENIDISEFVIIYKDSEGVWDGFNPITQDFIVISAESEEDAIENFTSNRVNQLLNERNN